MRAVLPVVLAAQFVVPMSISGTAIALPVIAADLGSDPTPLQWVVNGFNVAFALFTVVWGAVSDRIGHRASFRIGVLLTAGASLVSALAPSLLRSTRLACSPASVPLQSWWDPHRFCRCTFREPSESRHSLCSAR